MRRAFARARRMAGKVAGPRGGGGGGRREASQQYGANRTENESITLTKQLRGCHAPPCMFRGGGRRRSPSLRKPPRPPESLATSRAQPRPKLFTTRLRKIEFLSFFVFLFFSFLRSCGCFQLLRLLEDPPVPLQGVGRGGEGGGRGGGRGQSECYYSWGKECGINSYFSPRGPARQRQRQRDIFNPLGC